ncbi:MAG: hypothetical protein V3T32_00480 [Thermodesulfobacteriota bacterium]
MNKKSFAWNIKKFFSDIKANDPIRSCDVYKTIGCAHVDGYLCDMKTCNILKDFKIEKDKEND